MKSSPDILAFTAADGPVLMFCYSLPHVVPLGYLKAYDPEAHQGRGEAIFTADKDKALRFKSFGDALECWRFVSRHRPRRENDGKPNRPLTAFHASYPSYEQGEQPLDPLSHGILQVMGNRKQ